MLMLQFLIFLMMWCSVCEFNKNYIYYIYCIQRRTLYVVKHRYQNVWLFLCAAKTCSIITHWGPEWCQVGEFGKIPLVIWSSFRGTLSSMRSSNIWRYRRLTRPRSLSNDWLFQVDSTQITVQWLVVSGGYPDGCAWAVSEDREGWPDPDHCSMIGCFRLTRPRSLFNDWLFQVAIQMDALEQYLKIEKVDPTQITVHWLVVSGWPDPDHCSMIGCFRLTRPRSLFIDWLFQVAIQMDVLEQYLKIEKVDPTQITVQRLVVSGWPDPDHCSMIGCFRWPSRWMRLSSIWRLRRLTRPRSLVNDWFFQVAIQMDALEQYLKIEKVDPTQITGQWLVVSGGHPDGCAWAVSEDREGWPDPDHCSMIGCFRWPSRWMRLSSIWR